MGYSSDRTVYFFGPGDNFFASRDSSTKNPWTVAAEREIIRLADENEELRAEKRILEDLKEEEIKARNYAEQALAMQNEGELQRELRALKDEMSSHWIEWRAMRSQRDAAKAELGEAMKSAEQALAEVAKLRANPLNGEHAASRLRLALSCIRGAERYLGEIKP